MKYKRSPMRTWRRFLYRNFGVGNHVDEQYLEMLEHIMIHGVDKNDRTGTGTRSVFGYQMRFNLSKSFPLLTTKKVHVKSLTHENLWFISGDTNIKYLKDNKVTIWDEWADNNGDLGPVYGEQWRRWKNPNGTTTDQLKNVINSIKKNPDGRRHIVSAWHVSYIDEMRLPPCHCLFQFYVANGKLSCQLYQRSCDSFLGVPFNIASYAELTIMIAHICGLEPGEFIWTGGDVHIYKNHFKQVLEQLKRKPFKETAKLVILNKEVKEIDDFKFKDFEIQNYKFHPAIYAPVAV